MSAAKPDSMTRATTPSEGLCEMSATAPHTTLAVYAVNAELLSHGLAASCPARQASSEANVARVLIPSERFRGRPLRMEACTTLKAAPATPKRAAPTIKTSTFLNTSASVKY